MWRASVLTIFPEMFPGPLASSLAGKALASGIWSLDTHDIRDAATDKHRTVDDTPAGGGPGMVMKADVLARALDTVAARPAPAPADEPARRAADASARGAARRRAWRRHRLRPLRGRRRAADQGARARGSLARRFRAVGRRDRGARACSMPACGCCPASWARRPRPPRRASPTACWNTRNTPGRRCSRASRSRRCCMSGDHAKVARLAAGARPSG